jgi:ribonuclease HI
MTSKKKLTVTIYSDGACKGNPGPGAWAAIIITDDSGAPVEQEISGRSEHTTNNEMELTAVIKALESLKQPSTVKLYSDSAYIVNAFHQRWFDQWQCNGWKTSDRKPVKNRALWETLLQLCGRHHVSFIKVPGHAGHIYNERVDRLANQALK